MRVRKPHVFNLALEIIQVMGGATTEQIINEMRLRARYDGMKRRNLPTPNQLAQMLRLENVDRVFIKQATISNRGYRTTILSARWLPE